MFWCDIEKTASENQNRSQLIKLDAARVKKFRIIIRFLYETLILTDHLENVKILINYIDYLVPKFNYNCLQKLIDFFLIVQLFLHAKKTHAIRHARIIKC